MGKRLVQDEQEAVRMMEDGSGPTDMVRFYKSKYDLETSVSMWNNFRRRHGIDGQLVWDPEVIPWKVEDEHSHKYEAIRLRQYARRKAGKSFYEKVPGELDAFVRGLEKDDAVVHYDPDTDDGFHIVPRRPGIDTGIVRVPEKVTRRQPS